MDEQDIQQLILRSATDRYNKRLADMASSLRNLADRIERDGVVRPSFGIPHGQEAVAAAGRVIHDVVWEHANIGIDTLLSVASDVDEIVRGLED